MGSPRRIGGRGRTNGRPLAGVSGSGPGSHQPARYSLIRTFQRTRNPHDSGFVDVNDIQLWDENERLDVHVNQFEEEHGRAPTPAELLQIMPRRCR